ncbi:hypothetical protein ACJ73_02326 [Blastomyces percursus]|uniref:Gfd2/YDR514C-like C-terminal domain-containing protein n=1 Tax=Blastomyces percursus TaxID=1658174 RepID=A0A1J9QCN8_9EURO|nr:hypothetical protein ACJ73_02326 [Blastomyces percursus]
MDMQARLKLLFDGGDEKLLKTNTGLQSALEIATLSIKEQKTVNNPPDTAETSCQQSNQAGPSKKPAVEEPSSSENGFDEYLATFSEAARKSKRKKKIWNNNDNHCRGSTHADLSISTTAYDTLGAAFYSNGGRLFCPISAISRFPYKYIRGRDGERIAQHFFNEGKFWKRPWDIYYINLPPSISTRPLILVPSQQVQDLIDDINNVFKTHVFLPLDQEPGLLIPFENDGTPQPHYLGTSSSQEAKEELESTIPHAPTDHHEPPQGCSAEVDRSFASFKAKMAAAVDANRRKNKTARKKKEGDRVRKLQGWCRAMKRAQCYLGMRPRRPRDLEPPITDGLTWEEQKRVEREYALACGIILPPMYVNKVAPCRFASEPIFVCVDVEANEKNHYQITEIGVSTLDTLDLVGIPPGEGGINWIAKIRSRHFRISEYANVVNKEYVSGCPDSFEFGESEWISISKAGGVVDMCFQPPYSARAPKFPQDPADAQSSNLNRDGEDSQDGILQPSFSETKPFSDIDSIPENNTRPRNLIFVGHNAETDLAYLRKLGCKSFIKPSTTNPVTPRPLDNNSIELPNFIDILDTSILFRVLKRETEQPSLGKILVDLGITAWNLHNGGNDARYTMEALIGITLKSRLLLGKPVDYSKISTTNDWPLVSGLRPGTGAGGEPGQGLFQYDEEMRRAANAYDRKWKEEVENRIKMCVENSEARVRDECASWDMAVGAENMEVDGGEGKGLSD